MNTKIDGSRSFTGKFSTKTLSKLKKNLTAKEYKQVKDLRVGKRYTNIDIITVQTPPMRLMNGTVILPKETYAEFSNSRAKNGLKSRIKLSDFELPFNMDTVKLITSDLVERGENLLKLFRK